jgi:demethylmenaquinone methyltransferase/2-methoxy-6-polyprenyl-1,4-benzoquinol methylase
MSKSISGIDEMSHSDPGPGDLRSASVRTRYDQTYIRSLFDSIAPRYDLLNRLLSFGLDVVWRKRAIRLLEPLKPRAILDVATGTGDLALEAARLKPERIVGVDIAANMLEIGREKIRRRGLDGVIELSVGDAERLHFEDHNFDAVTVAFGVRNFSDLDAGLREMHRVLRPGGMAVILEFSRPRRFPMKQLYAFYSRRVLPFLGGLLSNNREAYQYLPRTVDEFPDGEAFLTILRSIGFSLAREHRMTCGITTIYLATK